MLFEVTRIDESCQLSRLKIVTAKAVAAFIAPLLVTVLVACSSPSGGFVPSSDTSAAQSSSPSSSRRPILVEQSVENSASAQPATSDEPSQQNTQQSQALAQAEEPPTPETQQPSGWVTGPDGLTRYFNPETHEPYTGWLHEQDATYYIDADTNLAHTGWLDLDGERYFFDSDGKQLVGWVSDGTGRSYWIKPETGAAASHEWVEIDGIYQAFDDDGSWVTLGDIVPPNDAANLQNMSARQAAVVAACDTTPWPGPGLCAGWISSVFETAGQTVPGGNACDMARAWCYSSDLSELKPGMIIAVASHHRTENGKIWGHICVYVGNGLIKDSGTYGIRRSSLGSWLAWFGASETPKWGWANGMSLE